MTKRRWTDKEGPVHQAVLQYLHTALPGALIHHSPNETSLKGPAVARMIAKQKHMGMVSGFPDLIVFWRGYTWAFEVKADKGRQTDSQKNVQAAFQENRFRYAVVRSLEDVREYVEHWRINDERKLRPVPSLYDIPVRGVVR